jgi:carotenoid phi-ring synthase / carotenoid chi-ring synthase
MNRRRFLKTSLGWTLGLSALGVGGGLAWLQPRRHTLPLPDGNDARASDGKGKRVVVIGGGLAGLAAATELAARHFDVTLLERAPQLGGKLTAWQENALGEQFPVEHGFHGFFAQYYNLRQLLDDAGVTNLSPSPGYPVLFADREPEVFGRTTRIFPFNMLSVVRQSHALRMRDFSRDGHGLYDLMKYDGEKTFAKFDGVDFAQFAVEGNINRPMVETVLAPFGKTTLNRLSRLSAAEAIRFFHFYFMGNPEGLGFSYLTRDSMTAVIEPLARRLQSLGGKIRVGLGAQKLVRDGVRVSGVVVEPDVPPPPKMMLALADVPPSGFRALPIADGNRVFVTRRDGGIVAFDGRCSHMGCPVAPKDMSDGNGGFRCPCHGGLFDGDGKPIAGPPKRPLTRLTVHADGERLVIGGDAPAPGEVIPCDYAVVACEVRGTQRLLGDSQFADAPALQQSVRALGEADPYVVWRLWLDKPVRDDRLPFYTTSRFSYCDSLAVYSRFQEPFIGWAKRSGGSVVEIHAYAIAPEMQKPASQVRAAMWKELVAMLPELDGARVLHDVFQQQSNFTRWAPGDHASRPATETAVPNLFFAGDWVKLPAPASLMEAAVMSGRLAANAILSREELRELPIPCVALRGPLA